MMLISKFHKLIRNKIVWSTFASFVAIAFVFSYTSTSTTNDAAALRAAAGKLNGKPVSAEEFQKAYFNSYLAMSLMLGRPLNISIRIDQALKDMAWRRLVSLRAAPDLSISANKAEIVGTIRGQPIFQDNNQFSEELYAGFVKQFLGAMNSSAQQFEENIRQEIILNKLNQAIAQTLWIAPAEIKAIFHQLYDKFTVCYIKITKEEIEHSVSISDAQTQTFFDEHQSEFTIPEMVRVKYVELPIENFVDQDAVDEETLRDYYEDNIADFTVEDTNEWTTTIPFIPFEEVEDDLREQLAWHEAINLADDKISLLEFSLVPNRDGEAPGFDEAAAGMGLTVSTTAFFAAEDILEEMQVGSDFNREAFDLRPTPEEYFSHPVQGKNSYYLLAYQERADAHVPDLSEVKQAIIEAARNSATSNLLDQLATNIQAVVQEAMDKGSSFSKAIEPFGLELITTESFMPASAFKDYFDNEEFIPLLKNILARNARELTGIIPITDGFVIGYVEKRVPADWTILGSIKKDLITLIKKRREETAFNAWQEYLLTSAKFEDLTPRPSADTEDEMEPEYPEDD